MSTTPGADQLQALVDLSNETTGGTDTTMSEAVATLISGYGSGGSSTSLQIELVDTATLELEEYTSTSAEYTTTSISIVDCPYSYMICTIDCDGTPASDTDWGGHTLAILGKYSDTGKGYAGANVWNATTSFLSADMVQNTHNSYAPVIEVTNQEYIKIARRCGSSYSTAIMGGTYTVKLYGVTAM